MCVPAGAELADRYHPMRRKIAQVVFYDRMCGFTVLAWGLHYFPFFLMQRQLVCSFFSWNTWVSESLMLGLLAVPTPLSPCTLFLDPHLLRRL
jgi:dolichyl-phosphate-mannose--protein O-mannosyl transferase